MYYGFRDTILSLYASSAWCIMRYIVHRGLVSCSFYVIPIIIIPFLISMDYYCMKPPNIKAPKCTLFSRVKGHKRSPVLPRLIASIVGGSLLWRAHFESLRVAEAKNAATINRLMSKRRSVLYFPLYFPGSKVTRAHRSYHGSFRAS